MTYYQRNKWGRARKTVVDGVKYDSKFEAGEASDLGMELKAGKIAGFESHVRLQLEANGFHICDYYVDFVVHHLDGSTEYRETKGMQTRDWVLKWKLLESMVADNPMITLTLVQQKRFRMRRIKKL